MKRDLDLVRAILIAVEDHEEQRGIFLSKLESQLDWEQSGIVYHVEIMEEAGLLLAKINKDEAGQTVLVYVQRLTWKGHEFLDAARNQDVWEKLKEATASKSLSLAAEVLQDLLTKYAFQKLGLDA